MSDTTEAICQYIEDYLMMRAEREAALSVYQDEDGNVSESDLREYDEERADADREASELLDAVMAVLLRVAGVELPDGQEGDQ
ncbi:hypothetical protein CTZ27_02995 [Streptomyces griseocarneus]|nr:hypothetical protein CTZ27_02995 [Streptomyces griseocarneus]